jgi:hypothetical protein
MPKREIREVLQSLNDNKLSFGVVGVALLSAWLFSIGTGDYGVIDTFNFIILTTILFKISQIVSILHRVMPLLVEYVRRVDPV